jgi:uncharacterized repeat protein (TIGR02059 family)
LKNTLLIFLLLISLAASGTDYYVSTSGSDSNTGLSAAASWKTLTKVNSVFASLKPGDKILFNRGDTFIGTLNITASGNSANPITIGSYGSGANPVITGFTTITGWTAEANGVYSKTISCQSSPNVLTINGKQYALGRYPNAGTYLTIDSHSSNTSITDADLNSGVTNWTGAEAVIRKNEYTLDRCTITGHSSGTLSYTDASSQEDATDGYYYFIQNDRRTLDQFGEWYYDGSKLYVYFGSATPTNYTVNLCTLDNLVYAYRYNYTTINGLTFRGSNKQLIYLRETDHSVVSGCTLDFGGTYGIYLITTYGLVDNNTISHTAVAAVTSAWTNTTITNNTIKDVGLIEGLSPVETASNGIDIFALTNLVQYNKLDSIGANGIRSLGSGGTFKNNFVSNFSLLMNDTGGLYANGGTSGSNLVIDGNIFINGIGKLGKSTYDYIVEGLYLDSYSKYVTATNNSIANCRGKGIQLSNASYITLQGNTSYNNLIQAFYLEWSDVNTFTNLTVLDNLFVSKEKTQVTLKTQSNTGTLGDFGVSDRNYYARPIDDNLTINTYDGQTDNNAIQYRTLASWQSYSGKDANSHKSPAAISSTANITFVYNETKSDKVVSLSAPMIDMKGTKYAGSITLSPFTSAVLIVDPNPATPIVPVCTSAEVKDATPTVVNMTFNVALAAVVPVAASFSVKVNGATRNVTAVSVSGSGVSLTLSNRIVYGDVITVSYTKPASNWLQSSAGVAASNITNQSVTNNCLKVITAVPDPVKTEKRNIIIYPNPVHDHFNIALDDSFSEPRTLKIVDLSSRIVYTEIIEPGTLNKNIPLNIKAGNYIVYLESKNSVIFYQKLIVI